MSSKSKRGKRPQERVKRQKAPVDESVRLKRSRIVIGIVLGVLMVLSILTPLIYAIIY